MSRIEIFRDRIAYIGATDSGKSTLARAHFEAAACSRLLVDSKRMWRVGGVEPVHDVVQIDWRAPLIHFQPRWWLDRDEADALYGAMLGRLRHATVWTDEAYAVSSANWPSSKIALLQAIGREPQIGHLVCTQRPRNVRREIFTEAQHLFVFPPLDDEDLETVRQGAAFVPREQLRDALQRVDYHGFLWLDRRARAMEIHPPLEEELRQPTLVFRRSGAG